MCLGIPGKVASVEGNKAQVQLGSVGLEVDVRLVEGVQPGDYLLIHAGFAINKIDEEEARTTLALIREMELYDETGTTLR